MSRSTPPAPTSTVGFNLAALRGRVTGPPTRRDLPGGGVVLAFDVTARIGDTGRRISVPVLWHDPPASAARLDTDDEVVVIGHVERRFFRAGGVTASRTEVVVQRLVPVRARKRALDALADAAAELEAVLDAGAP